MLKLPIKNYLIIGSYALGVRPAKDIDVICYYKDIEVECKEDDYSTSFMHNGIRVECLLADNQESFQYFLEEYGESYNKDKAPYEVLFAIKAGHITFPHRMWEKHIMDYHILKSQYDIDDSWTDLGRQSIDNMRKLHKKSTESRLGKQRLPKLIGVTKEKFFDDNVTKYMEHDDIHQMVAHKEKPMYSYMQEDPDKVECSKDLWEKFTEEEKVQCVLEECYVIAIERHLLPRLKDGKKTLDTREAFKWALMRVCTTLCSGWFRQFAIDNYFSILNSHNREYYNLLKLDI